MSSTVQVVHRLHREEDEEVRLRAVRIDLKGSITDTDGHLVREAHAEGGVKIKAKVMNPQYM